MKFALIIVAAASGDGEEHEEEEGFAATSDPSTPAGTHSGTGTSVNDGQ